MATGQNGETARATAIAIRRRGWLDAAGKVSCTDVFSASNKNPSERVSFRSTNNSEQFAICYERDGISYRRRKEG